MKISLLTTFHKEGYDNYGKNMLSSFDKFLPNDVDIIVFYEDKDGQPDYSSNRVKYYKLYKNCPDLVNFKLKYKNNNNANGLKTGKYNYSYDAIRFSHKSFTITTACKKFINEYDYLYWMDADSLAFDNISKDFLLSLLPNNYYSSYLGRKTKYTETGFIGFNLNHKCNIDFMNRWEYLYNNDIIFTLSEYHDCMAYDFCREEFSKEHNFFNISKEDNVDHLPHPFINSRIGKKIDHMKGPRKEKGSSHKTDIKSNLDIDYWKNVK